MFHRWKKPLMTTILILILFFKIRLWIYPRQFSHHYHHPYTCRKIARDQKRTRKSFCLHLRHSQCMSGDYYYEVMVMDTRIFSTGKEQIAYISMKKRSPTVRKCLNQKNSWYENFQMGSFPPHFSGKENPLKKPFWKNERGVKSHF